MISCNDSIRFRMRILACILVLPAAAMIVRLFHLQISRGDELSAKAASKYTGSRRTIGKRGEIFDTNGHLLVGNMPCMTLLIDPTHIKSDARRKQLAQALSRFVGKDAAELEAKLATMRPKVDRKKQIVRRPDGSPVMIPVRHSILANHIPLPQAAKLRAAMKQQGFRELQYQYDTMRHYPKNGLLANILGLTQGDSASDAVAIFGLEKFFDDRISPSGGKTVYTRARNGVPLLYDHQPLPDPARDGANIYLTIDEVLQSIMEEELDEAYRQWSPKAIYAVMVDPRTGNVLAIGQRPSFDPSAQGGIRNSDYRNRIVEDRMEPGSIAKPIAISGALDNRIVTPNTIVSCEGGHWIYLGKKLTDTHKNGNLSITDVIRVSSNIGTAKVALMMGDKMLYETFRSYGFGQHTGLPLRPESRCPMRDYRMWDKLTATRVCIGYSINVTPVQMARAYCAIANHGKLPKLRLVDRVEDPATGVTVKLPLEPPVQIFQRPETASEVVKMLKAVVGPGGTARQASIPGYYVAGKTGTSRKSLGKLGYTTKYFASFVGFVPADNPAFVLLVTTDEPQGGRYGGTVSGPTFRKIALRALNYLQIPPDPALMPKVEE